MFKFTEITEQILATTLLKEYNGQMRRYFPFGENYETANRNIFFAATNITKEELDKLTDMQVSYDFLEHGIGRYIEKFDGQYWYRTIHKI